jgi:hypothetical protein
MLYPSTIINRQMENRYPESVTAEELMPFASISA